MQRLALLCLVLVTVAAGTRPGSDSRPAEAPAPAPAAARIADESERPKLPITGPSTFEMGVLAIAGIALLEWRRRRIVAETAAF